MGSSPAPSAGSGQTRAGCADVARPDLSTQNGPSEPRNRGEAGPFGSLPAILLALAIASGVVNLGPGGGWLFRLNLLLHPVLGALACLALLRALQTLIMPGAVRSMRALGVGTAILFALAPVRTWLLDWLALEHAAWVNSRVLVPVAVAGAALVLRGLPPMASPVRSGATRLAAIGAALGWFAVAALGLVMLVPATRRHDLHLPQGRGLSAFLIAFAGWLFVGGGALVVTGVVTHLTLREVVSRLFRLLRKLVRDGSRLPRSLKLGVALLAVLWPVRKMVMARTTLPREDVDGRLGVPTVVVATILIVRGLVPLVRALATRERVPVVARGPRMRLPPLDHVARRVLGLLAGSRALVPLVLLGAVAWAVVLRPSDAHARRLLLLHEQWGGLALLMTAFALVGGTAAAARRLPWAALAGLAFGYVGVVLGEPWWMSWAGPGTVEVQTRVDAQAVAGDGALGRAADSGWLGLSASCGGERGCHGEIVAESRRSLHGAGARRLRALPVGATLAASAGCVACHTPSAPSLVAGNTDTDGDAREAIDCVLCHRTTDATVDPPWESRYSVGLMGGLLAPFRDAARAGRPLTGFGRYAIGLEGAAHGRTFSPPVVSEDRFCQSCHHLQLRVLVAGIRCVDCHMPEAQALGGVGSHRSHVFPGANVAAAVQLGDEGLVSVQSAWTRGACVASVPRLRDVPGEAETPVPAAALSEPCLGMTVALTASAQDRLRLTVTTSNAWMTHPFPAGSFDRLEAWLEIRVADEQGRVVYASGLRGEADGLDASVHRLGLPGGARVEPGSALGAGGAAVRVWHGTTSSGAAVILPGDSRGDVFEWADSRGASVGRLLVSARWLYRKTDAAWWSSEGGRGAVPALVVGERTEWLAPAPEPRGEM